MGTPKNAVGVSQTATVQAVAPKRWQLVAELQKIRKQALTAIRTPGKGLKDPWKLFGSLKGLKRFDYKAEYLEAKIAICVVGRIRPKVAFRALKKLRKQHEKDGALDRFDKFCDEIDAHLAPAALTQYGFDQKVLAGASHKKIWQDIDSVTKTLKKLGYTCFLNSGTLLGLTRDGGLIGYDDDIDLAVVLKAKGRKTAAREWLRLTEALGEAGLLQGDAPNCEYLKIQTSEGIAIDLFPAWSERGQMHIYPYSLGDLKSDDVLPLRKCKITGHAIPAKPERVLEVNYGAKWRMPDRLFRFGWANANLRFADFLDDVRSGLPEKADASAKAAVTQLKAA